MHEWHIILIFGGMLGGIFWFPLGMLVGARGRKL
jgi:hypothetical protein